MLFIQYGMLSENSFYIIVIFVVITVIVNVCYCYIVH